MTGRRIFNIEDIGDSDSLFQGDQLKKVISSNREFLNLAGSEDSGSIQAEITWVNGYKKDSPGYVRYNLKITDCSRSIELSFDGDSQTRRDNSIHKIDKLINTLKKFKDGLDDAFLIEDFIKKEDKRIKEEEEAKEKAEDKEEKTKED